MTTWRRSPAVEYVDSGDRVVVVDLTAHEPRPQVLEGVAALIWRQLEDPRTDEEVVAAVLDAYDDAQPEEVRRDVAAFLGQLDAAGLAVRDAG